MGKEKKNEQFKDRLNALIEKKGISVSALAKKAKISKTTLFNWTTGSNPSSDFDALDRVAELLGTDISFLLIGKVKDGRKASIDELYVRGQPLFDGICEVTIRPLVPREEEED